jgi:general secretion pathway protein N
MKIKISLAFIVIYLTLLVITAPASLINRFLPKHSGLQFEDVSGTLWSGKLSKVVYREKYRLKELTWKMNWLALTTLKIKADIEFNNGRRELLGAGSIAYGMSGLVITDINIDMQATELLPYLQLPVPVIPAGKLTLVVETGSPGDPYCKELDGYLVWHGAQADTPMGNIDLSSPNIDLSCANGDLVASLKQNSEQLTTNANATLKKGGYFQVEGNIMGHEKLEPSILQAIGWIGPKNAKGETRFNYKGRL